MNLKDKQRSETKTLSLRLFYSEMIKIFGGIGLYIYARPRVYYVSKAAAKKIKGGVLIAANHRSLKDVFMLFLTFWYRRLHFPAIAKLFEKPINRFFFYNMNCIPIDKSTYNVGALKTMCELLKRNKAVAIFPEGAINEDEELMSFKRGTAYMANKTGKPVVPVYIGERKKWWQQTPVIVGEPIDVATFCRNYPRTEAIDRASEYLRKEEIKLAEYCNAVCEKKNKRCV